MEKSLAVAVFILTMISVILKPKGIGIGWSAWAGALACLLLGIISPRDILYITKLVWDATLAFVFLIFISIILDRSGFFEWTALKAIGYAKGNGFLLFLYLMLLGAFISAIFANDGASLMLTPIIYSKIKHLRLPKRMILPYIMGSGFIADTASLPFVISNLTNIITAHFFKIDFWRYAFFMFLPNLVSVLSSIALLYIFYRRDMIKRYDTDILEDFPSRYAIRDPLLFKIGWTVIVFLGASFLLLELYKIKFPFSVIFGVSAFILSLSTLKNRVVKTKEVLRFTPWSIVFFSIGMYTVVYGLKNVGVTAFLADTISYFYRFGDAYALLGTGFLSALLSALMNNLPTVMVMNISIQDVSLPRRLMEFLALANLVGTNIGPKLTPIGSLATLLWLHVLEHKGIKISWLYYIKVGFVLTIPVLIAVLLTLYFVYRIT
ncbi:arsenic transporter [Hydrogenobacter thermophilus]|uniref:arsenic transporter n=1 Tax=Hydrogenobacter thermophilus TaxID=940 RepID=UPI0030F56C3B